MSGFWPRFELDLAACKTLASMQNRRSAKPLTSPKRNARATHSILIIVQQQPTAAASASALKASTHLALFSSHTICKQPLPRIDDQTHRIAAASSVRHRSAAQHAATKGKRKRRCRCTEPRRQGGGDARTSRRARSATASAPAARFCSRPSSTRSHTKVRRRPSPCRPSRCRSALLGSAAYNFKKGHAISTYVESVCWRSSARSLVRVCLAQRYCCRTSSVGICRVRRRGPRAAVGQPTTDWSPSSRLGATSL